MPTSLLLELVVALLLMVRPVLESLTTPLFLSTILVLDALALLLTAAELLEDTPLLL